MVQLCDFDQLTLGQHHEDHLRDICAVYVVVVLDTLHVASLDAVEERDKALFVKIMHHSGGAGQLPQQVHHQIGERVLAAQVTREIKNVEF